MTPIITGVQIPDGARKVLQECMVESDVGSMRVTSYGRTEHDQARIMFENLEKPLTGPLAKKYKDQIERYRALYAAAGDKVIDVYAANHAIIAKDDVITLMEAKIKEIGGWNVSHHICNGPDAPCWVPDIDPQSIRPAENYTALVDALEAHPRIKKLLKPPLDEAVHVEIAKDAS